VAKLDAVTPIEISARSPSPCLAGSHLPSQSSGLRRGWKLGRKAMRRSREKMLTFGLSIGFVMGLAFAVLSYLLVLSWEP
jgi:hypothetical protein